MKIINITIPEDCVLDISSFSPEENYLMLKIQLKHQVILIL